MPKEQLNRIWEECRGSLKNFSTRLLRSYFSEEEISAENVNVCGSYYGGIVKQQFDPVRIGLIKSHVIEYSGGNVMQKQWGDCVSAMNKYAFLQRRKKYKKQERIRINLQRAIK